MVARSFLWRAVYAAGLSYLPVPPGMTDPEAAVSSNELSDVRTDHRLQDAVLDSADVEAFLNELCRHAAGALGDREEILCGITLLRERKAATVASSSERAREMDEVQYKFDDGPCLSAARNQTTVHVADVNQEEHWADYIGAVADRGMQSILAVPFDLMGDAKAALNLYADRAHKFTDETVERAAAYAAEAARSLRLAVRIAHHSEIAEDLRTAMESRTAIDIAIGVIMCQSRCSQTEAFEFLKKASSHRNIKLRELAVQIVASAGQSAEPTTHFDR
ncbi:GAF and ANTAR domain-containing protein [Arthrobacter vasquezii]|nr:GAF and ANTAR domain-containing protein [Arthrobacter vasquezii]